MKAISATEFMQLDGLKRDYIIPGLLPEVGRLALYGVAKRGKSFLALQLAMSICQHIPFLGYDVVRPGPVLYLQFDTPPELWQDRLCQLKDQGIAIPDNLYVIHPSTQPRRINILDGAQARHIHDMVIAVQPKLVIVDVLASVHGLRENEEQDMKQVVTRLNTLFHGHAYMIVHHTPKPNLAPGAGKPSPSTAGRGSGYLGGEVDANWLLETNGPGEGVLRIEARFAAPTDEIRLVQNTSGLWIAAHPTKGRPAVAQNAYQEALAKDPTLAALSARDVEAKTGIPKSSVSRSRQTPQN